MKRLFLLGLVLFFCLTSSAFSRNFTPEPDGFRDLKWGTPFSKVKKDMVYMYTNKTPNWPYKLYKRPKDNLKIGLGEVDTIHYGFLNGKFHIVEVLVHNRKKFEDLKDAVFNKYGTTSKTSTARYTDLYLWVGEESRMALQYGKDEKGNDEGALLIFSAELQRIMEQASEQGF